MSENSGCGCSVRRRWFAGLKSVRAQVLASVVLIAAIAFAVRLYRLDAQSLWWDEAFSITLAGKSLVQIAFGDFHPPLYHYLLHFWLGLVGDTGFAARFLSVVWGTLMAPLAYQLGRRLFDSATGVAGALLVALSPVHLWYSQEARMYILQAVEYLALLLLFHQMTPPLPPRARGGRGGPPTGERRVWGAFIAVELAALYTHYFAALVIASLSANLLVRTAVDRRWGLAARWVGVHALVGLAYLPWLPVALPQMAVYKPEGAQSPQLGDFVWRVWHFFNSGTLALDARHATFIDLSSLAAGLFVAVIVVMVMWDPLRHQALQLLAHSVVPLGLVFLIMQARPGFHPRYVVMLATPLLLLLGRGVVLLFRGVAWKRGGAVGVAGIFLVTFAVSVQATVSDARFQREDVRSLARHLEKATGSQDLVLFGYQDDAFDYYWGRGTTTVVPIEPAAAARAAATETAATARMTPAEMRASVASLNLKVPDEELATRLADLVSGRNTVWLVTWDQAPVDKRAILPWLLERSGQVVERWQSPGLSAQAYRLQTTPELPVLTGAAADFGPVAVTGYFYEPAPVGEAVPVALRWRSVVTRSTPALVYKATVVLEDQKRRRIASQDVPLLDERGQRIVDWAHGAEAVNYYLLPLPVGTPPVSYHLRVGVYEANSVSDLNLRDAAGAPAGRRFTLGTVDVVRAVTRPETATPAAGYTVVGRSPADGLTLLGYALDRREGRADQPLGVALRWQATRGSLPDYSPTLRLSQQGRIVAEASGSPVYGTYPTSRWIAGEVVVDWRQLMIASDALRGGAALELVLGAEVTVLGEITIDAPNRNFSLLPVQHAMDVSLGGFARLVGYDLDRSRVKAGESLRLTLYWQAINDRTVNVSYTVFTHLLSEDGRLIAQHDGLPSGELRPTTGWVAGEIISDIHNIEFIVPDYQGKGRIAVGLYDLETMKRVTTADGQDHVLLPTTVDVAAGR